MSGFVRRYGSFPGQETITLIEGVVIVDLPPPGAVNGVGTGTVAVIGEFADMTYAVSVDTTGVVTTKPQPVEVTSAQDLLDKLGGFDESIGDTGISGGSGFIALRNKKFSRLICVPVNLASANAVRLYRDLPTNKSATNPTPIVTVSAGSVAAGREFKSGVNRVKVGKRCTFTGVGAYSQNVDGAVTAAGAPAQFQTFTSALGGFLTANGGVGVKKGDFLVLGVIGGAGALGVNAATYRVRSDPTLATALVVEKLDGTNFDWSTTTALPYRVHPATDADTGVGESDDAIACTVPARPLDATILAATTINPTIVPTAGTATTWDPLSGLQMRTHPTGALTYTSTIQAANAVSDATIDALYALCFDSLLADEMPSRDVNIVVPARTSETIRTKQRAHILDASAIGYGRISPVSPPLTTLTVSAVVTDASPGVGATRNERIIYNWPGAQTFIPEAVGFTMKGADGFNHADGMLDTQLNMWMAALLSNLAPERNPAQSTDPVPAILGAITSFQRGVSGLNMTDYILMRKMGIAAIRFDRTIGGFIFQSGVTSSLTSGQKNINRRRFADMLEDSCAERLNQFAKQPLTQELKDSAVGEMDAYLSGLKSENNPSAQRLNDYLIDDVSGNTPNLEAAGIFVIIMKVRTLPTGDFFVLQAEIGEGVTITAT